MGLRSVALVVAFSCAGAASACGGDDDRQAADREGRSEAGEDDGSARGEDPAQAPRGDRRGEGEAPGHDDDRMAPADTALSTWKDWERALERGAADDVIALYADGAELVLGGAVAASGRAEIERHFELRAAAIGDRERDPRVVIARDGEVVVVADVRGEHTGEILGIEPTGARLYRAEIWRTFVDTRGLITRQEVYADALNIQAQMQRRDIAARAPPARAEVGDAVVHAESGDGAPAASARKAAAAVFEALSAGDSQAFGAAFSPDGVLHDGSASQDATGRGAIAGHASSLRQAFPALEVRRLELWGAGDYVAATYELSGAHDGTWRRIRARASGARFDVPGAALLEVADGAVTRAWLLYDGAAIANAIEAPEAEDDD